MALVRSAYFAHRIRELGPLAAIPANPADPLSSCAREAASSFTASRVTSSCRDTPHFGIAFGEVPQRSTDSLVDSHAIIAQHLHLVFPSGCEHCQHCLVDLHGGDDFASAPTRAIPARALGRRRA